MGLVAILTVGEKDSIVGEIYCDGMYFGPIQDINGDWVVSKEEIDQCGLQWLKDLSLVEHQPVPVPTE